MHATLMLAEFVRHADPASDSLRHAVMHCMMDALGSAAAGHAAPAVAGLRAVARAAFGMGNSAVWFSGERLSAPGAVFCNSAAASVLDLDDGNRAARGHPGATVIPAALAAATSATTADELIAGIVAGYEVGVRVAHARDAANCPTSPSRQSGRWAGYAAAAAFGRLHGTPPDVLAHAFAIAGVTAPNQEANGSSGYSELTGNDVKEGIAWSAANGVLSVLLAEAGLTGPLDILDHESHFARAPLLDGLGDGGTAWKILDTYFKPYSCCRYNHAPIDALVDLMRTRALTADAIDSVAVHTFGWALQLGNKLEPVNLVDVQYSIPYCLGIAAVLGEGALTPVDERCLRAEHRGAISAFARKVHMHSDAALDARFPAETLARVVVRTAHAVHESPVTTPRGEPSRPLSTAELEQKFLSVTRVTLDSARQRAVLDGVRGLLVGDIASLRADIL